MRSGLRLTGGCQLAVNQFGMAFLQRQLKRLFANDFGILRLKLGMILPYGRLG